MEHQINIDEKELDRDINNLYLDSDKDQHIPLVDEEYFHKIYGKETYEKMKSEWDIKDKEKK
jgi:hypothetical protein